MYLLHVTTSLLLLAAMTKAHKLPQHIQQRSPEFESAVYELMTKVDIQKTVTSDSGMKILEQLITQSEVATGSCYEDIWQVVTDFRKFSSGNTYAMKGRLFMP